ncbi:putative integral membrane protein, Mpv17/PMP22 family [Lineolata rhizophorae]|uniref:Putative integral membrane protein, Mpv17/PMP22 family n=1 Tax=Lineolata rhizophorae TaxID=578093 RepID=A0A6A6NNS4_9PEZI|nr:putative integral membrane protein, Mpv17/PMP22 family [Lineolata rhizophorae]
MASPLISQTAQAAVLSATSNCLAQLLSAQRDSKPLTLTLEPILRFVAYAVVNTPPNVLWQEWLEAQFPGSASGGAPPTAPAENPDARGGGGAAEQEKDKAGPAPAPARLNVRNTAAKFALDQTVGAVVNTVMFIVVMAALAGKGWEGITRSVKEDFVPIFVAGLKLWPLVSIISFCLVPVHQRVVFGSAVGVVWGVYLSLIAG